MTNPTMMYGPDVWQDDPVREVYASLRAKANSLGFATVGEALERLKALFEDGRMMPMAYEYG